MKLKYELTLSKPKKNLPFNNINNIRSTSRIQCMSISPNMVKLAVCYSNTNYVELYDLNSNELKDKFALKSSGSKQSFQVIGMTFADDSERLAIGQSDNLIYVYKVGISWGQKKSIVNKYSLHSAINQLQWPSNGIVFASVDGRVKMIHTQTNKMNSLINVPNSICVSICYNQDQILSGFLNGQIWTNTISGNARESSSQLLVTLSTIPFALTLTSTGYICAAGSDGRILFHELVTETSDSRKTTSSTNKQTMEYGQDISIAVSSPSGTVIILVSQESFIVFELESRIWKQKLTVNLNNSFLITGLCWSVDGTKLIVSTINQAIKLFTCRWQSKLIGNRFEINYVGVRCIVIKDVLLNKSAMFSSNFDIQQIKIIKENFVIIWTTNTLIMGNLTNDYQRSEIEWTGVTNHGVKFSFDYENVVLISAIGELYLVELGQNQILGSVRTDFISPHLISVRMNERKCSTKIFAYLLDSKTIAIIDLITGLQLNIWSHTERIDWIELNETGQRLIFRDKALKLVLLLNVVLQDSIILLNSGCRFVQWVPGSDVIVGQSKNKLYVWYDYAKPVMLPVIGGEMNEAYEIERSNGQTKVRFMQPNTDIVLDEVLLEFDTAIDVGDLERAEAFLESLEQPASSAIGDINSMWLTLGNLALKNLNLSIAERAFAAIGNLAKVNFINQCQRDATMLALLDSDWNRFELGNFELVLTTYLNTYNWERAIKFAKKYGRNDLVHDLQEKHYQWLLNTGQHTIAAQILERDGKFEEAIDLYLKDGRLVQLTKLIVNQFAENNNINGQISKTLIEKIISKLLQANAFEEAGDLYQLNIIDNKQLALELFIKGKAFGKAIILARTHFPDQVVNLEKMYGEHLLNDLDDAASSVNHFIEAGHTERALEAAVQARQFDRASEIASILDNIPTNLGKKIAEFYVFKDELEMALEMYLNMGCVKEAVELLNNRGHYVRAYKIAKQLMSPEEAQEMYEIIAKSNELDGKLREAERIYLACGNIDLAISMYKNNREFESMIRLVRQYHPELLNETCIYLARELEADRFYKQAEQYYLMGSEWQQATLMYRNASLWEDAYRVARANGGSSAAKQVAFHWTQTISNAQESVTLLNRFGLLNQVVDYALENNEFEFALSLILNSPDLKHKLTDVQMKYAVWLENEGLFNEAEAIYIEANKPKEAVVMYLHRNKFDDAIRVAEQQGIQGEDDETIKDILTSQARFLFEQMKRINNFDRLDKIEALLLKADRIEQAVRIFRDTGLWENAIRIAEQYCPHLLDSLKRDMITSTTSHSSKQPTIGLSNASINTKVANPEISTEMSQLELTQAIKMAEQNGDNEAIVRYSILLSSQLLKEHQAFDSLRILAKHSSSIFILTDSKKLLSRIAVVLFSENDDFTEWVPLSQMYSLLRDCFLQLLAQNSSLNRSEKELFEKYLLISHYLSLKYILKEILNINALSSVINNIKELHLKLTISLLRYTDIIRADKAFYEAGITCRDSNRFEMAFVFLNHFLDLLDAIEEKNFNVDHSDFANTDIPYEVPLPLKTTYDKSIVEEIKGWVLQASMDIEISQSLPLDPMREGEVYEASLVNENKSKCLPCLVTGYPVTAKFKMIEFEKDKYVANKDDWNKLLMIAKVIDNGQLRQVLQFIVTLCGNSNIVQFSFQS